mmetsp:Transcript_4220/g.10879  ORF Transcript_4220/g.10879 Transcript_4220/m.10879 type:complete len:468 (+) Transcript_4220:379-1782(+)
MTLENASAILSSATADSSNERASRTSRSVMRSASVSWRALLAFSRRLSCACSSSDCASASLVPTSSCSTFARSSRSASRTEAVTLSSSSSSSATLSTSTSRPPSAALASAPLPPVGEGDCGGEQADPEAMTSRSSASSSPTRRVSCDTCSDCRRFASSASQSSFSSASLRRASIVFSASSCEMMDSLERAVRPSRREMSLFCSSARARRSPNVSSTLASRPSSSASRSAATRPSSATADSFSRRAFPSSSRHFSSAAACRTSASASCSRSACISSACRAASPVALAVVDVRRSSAMRATRCALPALLVCACWAASSACRTRLVARSSASWDCSSVSGCDVACDASDPAERSRRVGRCKPLALAKRLPPDAVPHPAGLRRRGAGVAVRLIGPKGASASSSWPLSSPVSEPGPPDSLSSALNEPLAPSSPPTSSASSSLRPPPPPSDPEPRDELSAAMPAAPAARAGAP